MGAVPWIGCAAIAVTTTLAGCAKSERIKPMPPAATSETTRSSDTVERTDTVTVQAQVAAIDHKTRMVTLRRSDGTEVTFRVGDEVQNLAQVKKGDLVTAVYRQAIAFRLRKPGEKDTGPKSAEGMARAKPGERPAAAGIEVIRVSATIVAVDRARGEITLRGPEGKSVTVTPRDRSILDDVKRGDRVEVTYSEAVAIAVEKP